MKGQNVSGPVTIRTATESNQVVLKWAAQGGSSGTARSILTITIENGQAERDRYGVLVLNEVTKEPVFKKNGGPIFIAINDDEC